MPTVLVADDTKMLRILARSFLERAGYAVLEAEDGRAVLERVRRDRPDLVLLDVSMPELDGPEVLRVLRADPATARLPVIMLTGHTQKDVVLRMLELGACAFLTKPLERGRFERAVRRALGSADLTPAAGAPPPPA